jgi:O-antigen/teichoic acid export membrane protein
LISALGPDAFGLLTLAWSCIGYFSLLDLGLGRALAQLTAADLAGGGESKIPARFWTSLHLMALVGALGAVVLVPMAGWFANYVFHLPPALQADGRQSLYLIAASIPVVTVSAGLRGFLEAHQRFRAVSAVRIGMGLLTFGAPLVLLPYSRRVTTFVAALLLTRVFGMAAYFALSASTMPALWHSRSLDLANAGGLLRLGGWMTVSNVVSPLMTYLDRFLIGAILSVGAVAYYVTPFEMATKLLLIPSALAGVLFPAFSGALVGDRASAGALYRRSLAVVVFILLPLSLAMAAFGRLGLKLWLGPVFANNTCHVLPILSLGVFVNGLAGVPFALIQAAARPDLTARLHLVEAPVFLAACWYLTKRFGIDGAALAWATRALVDAVALLLLARQWDFNVAPRLAVPTFSGARSS